MTDDIDIYRTAIVLVEMHGEDAPIQAAMKADVLLEAGDVEGVAAWKRIRKRMAIVIERRPACIASHSLTDNR